MPRIRRRAPQNRTLARAASPLMLALAAVALGGVAWADQDLFDDRPAVRPVQQRGALDPNSFYGKDSTEGVYVRDSALALEKFALAQRMERLKEWN